MYFVVVQVCLWTYAFRLVDSAVGNSGVGQTTYYYTDAATAQYKPHFHANRDEILKDLYGGQTHSKVELPKDPTIIDKDLKMPSTWKTSLALDMRLPEMLTLLWKEFIAVIIIRL